MKTPVNFKIITVLAIPIVLACFALLSSVQACPPGDGACSGFNTNEGFNSLLSNTTGTFNTALGFKTLQANTSGSHNTAVGGQALLNNNGNFNTAVGENSLVFNGSGSFNMALGQGALASNVTGSNNVAMGFQALNSNTDDNNTAVGYQALRSATGPAATFNTAIGFQALPVTTGNANVAVGDLTLLNDSSGFFNVAVGAAAGINQTTGHNNIYIGQGSFGVAGENNACYIQSIFGQLSSAGVGVFVNSAGKLGTATSSKRFKEDIKPMDKASEALFELKPVTFRYKKEIEPQAIPQWGLVAEDVEKVNPDLVVRDAEGKVNTVRYDVVYNMLLNEFLKEHKKVEAQQASIADLKSTVALQQKGLEALTARLKEQAAQIQKVSAQVETSKSAPKVVANQ